MHIGQVLMLVASQVMKLLVLVTTLKRQVLRIVYFWVRTVKLLPNMLQRLVIVLKAATKTASLLALTALLLQQIRYLLANGTVLPVHGPQPAVWPVSKILKWQAHCILMALGLKLIEVTVMYQLLGRIRIVQRVWLLVLLLKRGMRVLQRLVMVQQRLILTVQRLVGVLRLIILLKTVQPQVLIPQSKMNMKLVLVTRILIYIVI